MKAPGDWRIRTACLACLILVPFLRFLARNSYGVLRVETLAACLLLLAVCVVAARLAHGVPFVLLTAALVMAMATYPIQTSYKGLSVAPPWAVGASVFLIALLALRLMGEKFYPVMAVFAVSGLLVEAALPLVGRAAAHSSGTANPKGSIVWLILDEHIGLDGFPETPECRSAKSRLSQTLSRYNFTLYPSAYSNYASTLYSLPSLLNGRLLDRPGELAERSGTGQLRQYRILANRLFKEYLSEGYLVAGYQHGSVRFCAAEPDAVECREYRDRLGWLDRAPGDWKERFRWLVGAYQAGDPWLKATRGFFPFRCSTKITGPLALEGFWPDRFAGDVLAAQHKTLFFAHLMTPHLPYLYRRDGAIRPLEEWRGDHADHRVSSHEYDSLYCRYCEQVEFLATQLDRLLARLEEGGALKEMTVILHGDHGSRIRRKMGARSDEDTLAPDVWDYAGEPGLRDLLDRFSTLLAIKPAGAAAPAVKSGKHSLLTWISWELFGEEPLDGARDADMVYLTVEQQKFAALDIRRYWK